MTVKELIQALLEHDMESEVEIVGNVNEQDYEVFQNFTIDEDYRITGKNGVTINFQTDGMAFVEEGRLEELEELEEANEQ